MQAPHHNTGNSLLVSFQCTFVATLASCVTFVRVLHDTKLTIFTVIVDLQPFLPPPQTIMIIIILLLLYPLTQNGLLMGHSTPTLFQGSPSRCHCWVYSHVALWPHIEAKLINAHLFPRALPLDGKPVPAARSYTTTGAPSHTSCHAH